MYKQKPLKTHIVFKVYIKVAVSTESDLNLNVFDSLKRTGVLRSEVIH